MTDTVNRQILLVEKPTGKLGPEHFKMTKGAIPEPKDGEVLVRARYISLDAANRAVLVDLVKARARSGVAVIGIFHDEDVRDHLADRLVDVTRFARKRAA